MEQRKLKKEVKEHFIKNGALLQKIAHKRNRHFGSVYRWFNCDSEDLMHIDVLEIIMSETGLNMNEIFEGPHKNMTHESIEK